LKIKEQEIAPNPIFQKYSKKDLKFKAFIMESPQISYFTIRFPPSG